MRLQDKNFIYPATVSDLWLPNTKDWNISLLTKLFGTENANLVANIPINNDNGDDTLIWKHTASGICTSKSAYQVYSPSFYGLKNNSNQPISSQSRTILQGIWKCDNLPPRVQVFGWRLMRGAIATGMRAGARSKHIQPYCVRCGKMEDDFHLFFDCKFSQAVWFASPLGLKVEGLYNMVNTQFQDIIYYVLASYKNEDAFQIVFSILWSIWRARNDLLFNKKKCSPLQVLFQAKALQKEKKEDLTGYMKNLQADDDFKATRKANQNWKRTAKYPNIYTDAAWKTKKFLTWWSNATQRKGWYRNTSQLQMERS